MTEDPGLALMQVHERLLGRPLRLADPPQNIEVLVAIAALETKAEG